MKKENKNVVVVSCPPCGENALEGQKGVLTKAVVGQALPDNAPAKGHLAAFAARAVIPQCFCAGYSGRFAFTLIELLVVVLIIGILAAVAVPQYQKTIERSKATEAMTLLSSIAKAYQTHYLANGQYAKKFDELDVDIPFTGTTKFYGSAKDTKSNKDWSFQIQVNNDGVGLYAARIDGKYKGAGFSVGFDNPTHTSTKQIRCFERKKTADVLFDKNLPEGAYCERVLQATKTGADEWGRYYQLP